MYKYFLAVLCCYYNSIFACDFCGCSPAVMNIDVMSLHPQSSIGTSVQYRRFSHLLSDANLKQTQITTQSFSVSYAPKKWVDLSLSLPLIWMINDYKELDGSIASLKEKKFGIGDLMLFSNFRVLTRPAFGGKRVGHILNVGFGLGLPTGSKKSSANELLQNFNFGTQMLSFYFSGTHSMSIKNWSLSNAILVKINMYNKDRIKYGNIYTYQAATNYTFFLKKISITPVMGIRSDITQKNLYNSIIQKKSGAWTVSANIGFQILFKNLSVNLNVLQPVVQKISEGNIKEKTGFYCNVRYQIKHKVKVKNTETKN
jgi:hypothetical protein